MILLVAMQLNFMCPALVNGRIDHTRQVPCYCVDKPKKCAPPKKKPSG